MNVRFWWSSHRDTALRLLSIAGSYASLAGVVFALQLPAWPWWALPLAILSLVLLVVLVVLELTGGRPQTTYAKDDARGIQGYMRRWISNSGRVAIWSRDLTWANSPDVKELLLQKARTGELVLCVPHSTEFTGDLAKAGADVCVYGVGAYVPASRFTITDFGKQGARVAVGRAQGDFHVIDEYDATAHPAFYLAQDLVLLVRAHQSGEVSRA